MQALWRWSSVHNLIHNLVILIIICRFVIASSGLLLSIRSLTFTSTLLGLASTLLGLASISFFSFFSRGLASGLASGFGGLASGIVGLLHQRMLKFSNNSRHVL